MKKEYGFSFIEIIVGLAIIGLLMGIMIPMIAPSMNFLAQLESDNKIEELKTAMSAYYRDNMAEIIQNSTSSPTDNTLQTAMGNVSTFGCENEYTKDAIEAGENIKALGSYLPRSSSDLIKDGYGQTMCIAVSPLLYRTYSGVNLYYRNIAIISRGANGSLDATLSGSDPSAPQNINEIFQPLSGTLVLDTQAQAYNTSYVVKNVFNDRGTDDKVVLIDGFPLALEAYNKTNQTLKTIKMAYETYFNVRYLMETSRNISYDYFYHDPANPTGRSDQSSVGAIMRTHGNSDTTLSATYSAYAKAISGTYNAVRLTNDVEGNGVVNNDDLFLGMKSSDLKDAFGYSIYFDNSSSKVRSTSGNNLLPGTDTPPYSATFIARMPVPTIVAAQQYLTATAIGTY